MPSSRESNGHWAAILDEFEEQLARVDTLTHDLTEAGLVVPFGEFAELPVVAGPLPPGMRERAATILAAQRETMARLEQLRTELARHIGVTRAASNRADVAVYLDRTA